MSGYEVIYWRSKDGGPWEQIEVGPRSIVGWNLSQFKAGEIYDDGYGNRYRFEVKR
jgi:hypothetical protein